MTKASNILKTICQIGARSVVLLILVGGLCLPAVSVHAQNSGYVPSYRYSSLNSHSNSTSNELSGCHVKCGVSCYYKEVENCTFCPLMATVFNAASNVTALAVNTFSGSINKVVIIGFALWLAFKVLAFVSSIEVRDLKDLVQELLVQGFVVAIVVALLSGGVLSFYNLALAPVYNTGQRLAQTIIMPEKVAVGASGLQNIQIDDKNPAAIQACTGQTGVLEIASGLPKSMGDNIICTMTLMQNRIAKVKALGSASLCYSWDRGFFIIPHLAYFFIGLGLWVGAVVMMVSIPFTMVDSIFQLAVAGALLPFGIGSYAFKVTRKYSGKIWETFLNSTIAFVFVTLTALMLVVAFENILLANTGHIDALSEDYNISEILVELPWFSVKFLELVFVMILVWSVLKASLQFSGEFASSISSTSIGSNIGTMAASASKGMATKIAKPVVSAAASESWRLTKAAAVVPVHYARRAIANRQGRRAMEKGTFDAATGLYTYQQGNKIIKARKSADGKMHVEKSKVKANKDGSQSVKNKIRNEDFTITMSEKRDANGNVIGFDQDFSFNSSAAKELLNEDGSLNGEKMTNLLNKYKDDELTQIMILKTLNAQRMENIGGKIRSGRNIKEQRLLRDGNGNAVGYEEIGMDGTVTRSQIQIGAANNRGRRRVMTSFMTVDKNGRGVELQSDGIVNAKKTFRTADGTAGGQIDQKSVRSASALSAYYESFVQSKRGGYVKNAMQDSMFAGEEGEKFKEDALSERSSSSIYEFKKYH